MLHDHYFLIPIFIRFIVQLIKGTVDIFSNEFGSGKWWEYVIKNIRSFSWIKKNIIKIFTASGGFPSGHSALAASVLCLIGLVEGIRSPLFMLAFVFAFLRRYDAMHVRYQTGQHAKVINQLKTYYESTIDTRLKNIFLFKKFRERVWHTFWEVLGGVFFGVILTLFFYYSLY